MQLWLMQTIGHDITDPITCNVNSIISAGNGVSSGDKYQDIIIEMIRCVWLFYLEYQ